jgi:hypothetical protein
MTEVIFPIYSMWALVEEVIQHFDFNDPDAASWIACTANDRLTVESKDFDK